MTTPNILPLLPRLVCASGMLLFHGSVAAQSCTVTATTVTAAAYDPFGVNTPTAGSFSFTCNKTGSQSFPATYAVGVTTGNVLVGSGTAAGSSLSYSLHHSNCSTPWSDGSPILVNHVAGTNNNRSGTMNVNFCMVIASGQTSAKPGSTATSYSDTETVNVKDSAAPGTSYSSGTVITFNTTVNASCSVLSIDPLVLNYVAFSGSSVSADSTLNVRCNNGVSYSLSLDALPRTLLGLTYSLELRDTLGPLSNPKSGSGSGQQYTIRGTLAADQQGICAAANPATCTDTRNHSVTITY